MKDHIGSAGKVCLKFKSLELIGLYPSISTMLLTGLPIQNIRIMTSQGRRTTNNSPVRAGPYIDEPGAGGGAGQCLL